MGPVLKLPVWSPRKKVKVIVSKEETKLYKEEWKALINLAIEEIESSTRSFVMSLSELSLAEKTSKETKKILSITKSKLEVGMVSQLELIEDERQFLETNRRAVISRLQVFQFALDLTKALGLKWRE
jgi:outer membrane protein TolC